MKTIEWNKPVPTRHITNQCGSLSLPSTTSPSLTYEVTKAEIYVEKKTSHSYKPPKPTKPHTDDSISKEDVVTKTSYKFRVKLEVNVTNHTASQLGIRMSTTTYYDSGRPVDSNAQPLSSVEKVAASRTQKIIFYCFREVSKSYPSVIKGDILNKLDLHATLYTY